MAAHNETKASGSTVQPKKSRGWGTGIFKKLSNNTTERYIPPAMPTKLLKAVEIGDRVASPLGTVKLLRFQSLRLSLIEKMVAKSISSKIAKAGSITFPPQIS